MTTEEQTETLRSKKEFKRIQVLGSIGIKIQTSTQIDREEHHCILIQFHVTISMNKPELTKKQFNSSMPSVEETGNGFQ